MLPSPCRLLEGNEDNTIVRRIVSQRGGLRISAVDLIEYEHP
jgi:hypothetical protein